MHYSTQHAAAHAYGFRVHTLEAKPGDTGPAEELAGRWWWTLARPGADIETDPEDHASEGAAWDTAIAAHRSGDY